MSYLKLEPGRPQTVAVKFLPPAECTGFNGTEHRWILVDGRALYTSVDVSREIARLNIQAREKFQIEKLDTQPATYRITKLSAQPAARIAETRDEELGIPGENNTRVRKPELREALITAINAAARSERQAAENGYELKFTPTDIREMAIAISRG